MSAVKVLFAPDYRAANVYQGLLAEALAHEEVDVAFLSNYRRVLPLWRGIRDRADDLLHLHWPEAYYLPNYVRRIRYRLDLGLIAREMKIVLTAHDLMPHNRADELLARLNIQFTIDCAKAVFVHSAAALELLEKTYRVPRSKCHFIPHGDLTTRLVPLPSKYEARCALGFEQGQRICLMFGTVEPYKGIEPVVLWWRSHSPDAMLAIVGKPFSPEYARSLVDLAGNHPGISFHLDWQLDDAHAAWLAAADCMILNYRKILTSGAACEARSVGLPILLPARHKSIELGEPHKSVFRFDSLETDFKNQLENALRTNSNYECARGWRECTSWRNVARKTAAVYRLVGSSSK